MTPSKLYTQFRELIKDTTSGSYLVSDGLVYNALDSGISTASHKIMSYKVEDVTLTSQNITDGYFTTTLDPIFFEYEYFGVQGVDYVIESYNKIVLLRPSQWNPQTFTDVAYRRFFKRFKGATMQDTAHDHPRDLDYHIVMYALGEFMSTHITINADGSNNAIASKSEDGLSVSYFAGLINEHGSPEALKSNALKGFAKHPQAESNYFTVSL